MDGGSLSDTQRTMVLPLLQETNIRGHPYVTVSSKGIANGLSRYPNDGADFGPDTTKGATSIGQISSPYTQTVGIQESVNYVFSNGITFSGTGGKSLLIGSIYLDGNVFEIDAPITIPAASSGMYGPNLTIKGRGLQNTLLNFNFNSEWGITISPDNSYGMFSFEGFSPSSGIGYTPNGWLNADWNGSSNAGQSNMIG